MNPLQSKMKGLRQVWAFDNRWPLLVQRLVFPREPVLVYRLGGITFVEDHAGGDANGAREVLTTSMYTDHLRHVRPGGPMNVLDIGANNGGFPLLLRHLGLPLQRVVSVELNPRTAARLRFNLDRNIDAPHEAVNAALCGRSGWLSVALGDGDVGDSIYAASAGAPPAGARPPARVRGVTFDELVTEYFGEGALIDICKIDVEFAEYEVFASPGHDLLGRCRWLIIEIHEGPTHAPRDVVSAILRHGFEELPRGSDPAVYAFRNARLASTTPHS
jgi:FkbM family methyltransferase